MSRRRQPCALCGVLVFTESHVEHSMCRACRRGEPPRQCEECGRGPAGVRMIRSRGADVCQTCYQRERPRREGQPVPAPQRVQSGTCLGCHEERLRLDADGRCTACAHAERVRRERMRTPEGRAIEREMEEARRRVAERRRREYEEAHRAIAERGGLPGDPLRRAG